ncbi:MAG TPA: M28 family peptidase, partial [Acidobacteriota bacterium]|nr:M28 family peptidase [Acidobacteriota bacterium]
MRKFVFVLFIAFVQVVSAAEPNLKNIKQLTSGGENAEAYFSSDGRRLIFQSTRGGYPCDQIYIMNIDGSGVRQISTVGRSTCAYFYPDGKRILYSSTHAASPACPPPADRSRGYVWPLYESYDIYSTTTSGELKPLAPAKGYDAEATISPDGKSIVFTSDRDGDLELYVMNQDGSNVRRLTNFPGYDGGAFFSADSKQIVYRAHHITDEKELKDYRDLLKQHLVRPTKLEIYVMNADGTNIRQVTNNGAANFAPFFHPDGKRIIYASNLHDPTGRNFDLYMINTDGKGLKRITDNPTFDGFPMFSSDGKKLVFASNRNAKTQGETNIFIADWAEDIGDSRTTDEEISIARLKHHIEYLASDELKGRLAGSPEARKAAEYIANEFKQYGLVPPPGQQTYFQKFEFNAGVKPGPNNQLRVQTSEGELQYAFQKEFVPAGYSDDATLKNIHFVFAGYGIRAASLNHDDYSNLDVKGKAVIVKRYGPEGDDPKNRFAQYYAVRYKAMTAREAGAAALLVVMDPEDKLPTLRLDKNPGTAGLPVIYIRRDAVEAWLKAANKSFPDPKNPHAQTSFELEGTQLSFRTDLIREKANTDNVLGWLSAGSKTDQTIIIGAHYDHLGLGIEGSLAKKPGEIHNGADDNASGVGALLELARTLSENRTQLTHNVLFITFGAEELGVLGSSYFVKNPVVPLKNVSAMLNLDMVGRLRESKLVVGGAGTSSDWKELLASANQESLKLSYQEDGYGPSD